jgi:hypothetical protein
LPSRSPGLAAAERRYIDATPTSRALFERAQGVLPAGIGRAGLPFFIHPFFVDRADGAYLYDVDGRAILDMWNGASSLPLGHRHPQVVTAMQAQLDKGLGFGAPAEAELILAERIKARIPSMEHVRFTSSGTEATMFAIRLARAFTGRQLIARMGNSYHGTHDMLMSGTIPRSKGLDLGDRRTDEKGFDVAESRLTNETHGLEAKRFCRRHQDPVRKHVALDASNDGLGPRDILFADLESLTRMEPILSIGSSTTAELLSPNPGISLIDLFSYSWM